MKSAYAIMLSPIPRFSVQMSKLPGGTDIPGSSGSKNAILPQEGQAGMGQAVDLDARYSVNRPLVVSDTIEDETVILHHGSGRYFDTAGTGAFIWRQIEAGNPPRSIAHAIEAGADISSETALEAVAAFTTVLLANDLISPARSDESRRGHGPVVGPAEFSQPLLGVHTDLADMLLLDPIHDVGPTGWPRRPDVAPPTASLPVGSFDAP